MAAPSSSTWTSPEAVAYLMGVTLKGAAAFNDVTNPTKTMVQTFIGWIASQVEMQFSMAGYLIPLAELSGETWPASQTAYLQLVTTLGTVAMAGGYAQKPLPAVAPGKAGGTGNVFGDLYNAELAKIWNPQTKATTLNFRAAYRIGSAAQIALTDPRGPTTEFMEGYYDPMRYYDNWLIADKLMAIEHAMTDMDISWDYMFGLLNKGFGTSIYESVGPATDERVLG